MMNKIRVAIYGGSGYGGSELLRILLFHPDVELVFVTANEHAGKRVVLAIPLALHPRPKRGRRARISTSEERKKATRFTPGTLLKRPTPTSSLPVWT